MAIAAAVPVIVRAAAALAPDEAARRAAAGADPVWVSCPGDGAEDDVVIARDVVAADPARVVRGSSIAELGRAWAEARQRWGGAGSAAPSGVPVGVGWLSYDLARGWTSIGADLGATGAGGRGGPGPADGSTAHAGGRARDDHGWPDLEFRFYDAVWVRAAGAADARIIAGDAAAAGRLAALLDRPARDEPAPTLGALAADRPRAPYLEAVARIQDYLRAGDAYQVNLARRLTAAIGPGDPVWIAAALRARAPAPHAIWIGGRSVVGGALDRYVVGNSPERFLRVGTDGAVETRPIKGTRPRQGEAADDAAMRAALAASAKDRAEHVMIVDLERNDLGRICRTGSVTVDGLMRVIELPTLFHLVSTVRGRLRADVGLEEILHALFPGGSVTGAPKRRAMEIIEELEPVRRGIYTGATGWLGAAGDLDLAIAIRTATVAAGRLSLSVGGGIVADSDAAAEWDETEVKARAFRALCG